MKKIFAIWLLLLFGVFNVNAASGITNYGLPQEPDRLRILGVGNSFTDDGMM